MILQNHVPDILYGKIFRYFMDLCFLDHKRQFKKCLQGLVFLNPKRMIQVQEELVEAASSGDHETLEKYLKLGHRFHVLDTAIIFGHYECVRVTLEHSGSQRAIEMHGEGPVVLALEYNRLDILRLLLKRGFNPWGTDRAPAMNIIEWSSMYERNLILEVYIECGVGFSATRMLKTESANTLGFLMKRGYDPTEELMLRCDYDWWGSRARLFKLIYSSCCYPDLYNWSMLSRFMDHDEVSIGGGLLEFDNNSRDLRKLLETLRDSGMSKYDFLWLQE